MRYTHYLYIVPFALLAACSSDVQVSSTDVIGKEAIVLSAGIVEGAQQAVTRAAETGENTTNHGTHLALFNGTKLALRVSGTWTGHSSESVTKTTTATVGNATGTDNKHNSLTFSPTLYWDDYGTADANNTAGRTAGLTIYGAAIDGKTTVPNDLSSSTPFDWTLPTNQNESNNNPADKDLLISNNVSSLTSSDYDNYKLDCGTYKFDDFKNNIGKLLEFHHAMSKITVILTPGAGFTDSKFEGTPEVTLSTTDIGKTKGNPEWAYTKGTVDVTNAGLITILNTLDSIYMHTVEKNISTGVVTKDALVMPGSTFPETGNMLRVNADGNIYYVTAAKIRAAIDAYYNNSAHDYKTKPGFNYIIKVTVKKTDVVVTATIAKWNDVESESVSPVINLSANYGTVVTSSTSSDKVFAKNFSFYRSTSLNSGYDATSTNENGYYKEESFITYALDTSTDPYTHTWTMNPVLYWPNHNTHYQFRGVWPETVTIAGTVTSPRVETSSDGLQVIKVNNTAYTINTFPSDLMIGRPDVGENDKCTNKESGHIETNLYTGGICATEGTINLAFNYMMSQVEVNLTSSNSTDKNYVDINNAVVELVNVYNNGDVKLGDRGIILPTSSKTDYALNMVSTDAKHYLSAIVPQPLAYSTAQADGNAKFRIKIKSGNTVTDVYYADIAPILKKDQSTLVAPGEADTAKTDPKKAAWLSGYHYVYNLYLTKTAVKVTATLEDWKKVEASQNVWF